ncbi:hypothetical protein HK104_001202 [Borealophlyctis nickersoniae]|nr:hypothetical protein HK104_001202 [Borealophlyctis nickersoniae]
MGNCIAPAEAGKVPGQRAVAWEVKHGRRYLKAYNAFGTQGSNERALIYPLPHDDDELERLNMQHYFLRYIFQTNFCAPIDETLRTSDTKILDVGCGSGIWAMEMGTEYRNAQITAIDLAPAQPTTIKPPNVEFAIHDITQRFPFPDNAFDFVRMRFLVLSLKADQWEHVISEIVRVCKPGGYVELCEPEFRGVEDMVVQKQFYLAVAKLMTERGAGLEAATKLASYLTTAHLEDVQTVTHTGPYGINPSNPHFDRLAELARGYILATMNSFRPVLVAGGEVSSEEYDRMIAESTEKLKFSGSIWTVHAAYGRKPL